MSKQPYFAPRGPSSPANIIVNANAPIVEIKIIMDCRFQPAKFQMMAPQNMPASVVMKTLNDAIGTLLNMQIELDMKNSCQHPGVYRGEKCGQCGQIAGQVAAAEKLPDLPPAPDNS